MIKFLFFFPDFGDFWGWVGGSDRIWKIPDFFFFFFDPFPRGVNRKFKGFFKEVLSVFQGSLKGVSRKFQECFKKVSGKYQECFSVSAKIKGF